MTKKEIKKSLKNLGISIQVLHLEKIDELENGENVYQFIYTFDMDYVPRKDYSNVKQIIEPEKEMIASDVLEIIEYI